MVQVHQQYSPLGVEFIGLTNEDSSALDASKAFLNNLGITWPNGYGAGETTDALGIGGIPAIFVVGTDGKLLWRNEMPGKIEDALDAALWLRDHPE